MLVLVLVLVGADVRGNFRRYGDGGHVDVQDRLCEGFGCTGYVASRIVSLLSLFYFARSVRFVTSAE